MRGRLWEGTVRWWRGRYGAALLGEFAIVFVLLTAYRFGRYLARDHVAAAFDHARSVLWLERHMGLLIEDNLQHALLPHRWAIELLNEYYARAHFPVTTVFIVVAYVKAPIEYVPIRRLFAAVTAMALAIHMTYPLAPPRMMHGFVDTLMRYGPGVYDRADIASIANQYAAMPSLHFGWSVLVAWGVVKIFRSPWRWLIVVHPIMTFLAITATANHYWLDAAVAVLLILAAAPVVARWPDPRSGLRVLRLGARTA